MLRNGFVIVLAFGLLFGGFRSLADAAPPANAATPAQVNAAIAARQATLARASKKHHKRHHHHKKGTTGQVVPAIK